MAKVEKQIKRTIKDLVPGDIFIYYEKEYLAIKWDSDNKTMHAFDIECECTIKFVTLNSNVEYVGKLVKGQ